MLFDIVILYSTMLTVLEEALMFKYAGPGLYLYLDDATKTIRVLIDKPIFPGMKSHRSEVASYPNSEEWTKSPYCSRVTDEDMLDSIQWFWIDHNAEVPRASESPTP